MTKAAEIKTNCYNCIYLDFYEEESYESSDQSGFVCEGRDLFGVKQEKFMRDIQRASYREKSKMCCELKNG